MYDGYVVFYHWLDRLQYYICACICVYIYVINNYYLCIDFLIYLSYIYIYIYTYILSGNTGPTRWVLCHFLGIGHLDPWRCVATCSTNETLPNGDRGMGRYHCEPSIGPSFSPWQPSVSLLQISVRSPSSANFASFCPWLPL